MRNVGGKAAQGRVKPIASAGRKDPDGGSSLFGESRLTGHKQTAFIGFATVGDTR